MLNPLISEDLAARRERDKKRVFPRGKVWGEEKKDILCGLGVRDIAMEMGCSPSVVSRLFNRIHSPRLETLEKMAVVLTRLTHRTITVHDVIDLIYAQPWNQPLTLEDGREIASPHKRPHSYKGRVVE